MKGWIFNKADKNAEADWKKGEISIRCSTHDDKWLLKQAMESSWDEEYMEALVDHILPRLTESKLEEEMVRAAREGQWEKEKVQALLCQKSTEGTIIFSMLDIQQEVALWNPGATNEIAHLMPREFIQWLISQANEGKCSGQGKRQRKKQRARQREEVGSIVCRKNRDRWRCSTRQKPSVQFHTWMQTSSSGCTRRQSKEDGTGQWCSSPEERRGGWKNCYRCTSAKR